MTIDSINRLNLNNENKFLAIKVNKLDKQAGQYSVTLVLGETMEFKVSDKSSDYQEYNAENSSLEIPNVLAGQLKVNSIHHAFNGSIPITIFDSQAV